MSKKTVFIVYAHYEPMSFNGALKNAAVESFTEQGHEVIVSDLYSMHFKPTTTRDDIVGTFDTKFEHFKYPPDTSEAAKRGALSEDIMQEFNKLEKADLVIFQFPMQWFSFPAILKGWFDRVLVLGKAYGYGDFYSNGVFKGRRAMLSVTTGGPENMYGKHSINGNMELILWPMQNGILNFLGFDVLKPHVNYAVAHQSRDDLAKVIESWEERLKGIFDEEPLRYLKLEDFESNGIGPAKKEALEKARNEGYLPIGQKL